MVAVNQNFKNLLIAADTKGLRIFHLFWSLSTMLSYLTHSSACLIRLVL